MNSEQWQEWYNLLCVEIVLLAEEVGLDGHTWDRDDADMVDAIKDIREHVIQRKETAKQRRQQGQASSNAKATPQRAAKRECMAIGCDVLVPSHLLMCKLHWSMVDPPIRAEVLLHYRAGQEQDGNRTDKYDKAMYRAINCVARKEKRLSNE